MKTNKNPTRYSMQKNLKVCIYTKTKEKKMIHDLQENTKRVAGDFASHLSNYIQWHSMLFLRTPISLVDGL